MRTTPSVVAAPGSLRDVVRRIEWDAERDDWLLTVICRCRVRHQVAFGDLPLRCKCGRVWRRELTGA